MRILVTNDDGINAPGLKVLEAIASDLAGPKGEVWTVAPAFEQSGVGHAISYVHPTMITQMDDRRYAAEGSPADCVLAGVHDVLADAPPDLILSGVNRGNNAGENVVYSGTIGAAMEGALQGIPSVAMSQFYGPGNARLDDPFEAARCHGAATLRALLDHGEWEGGPYRTFYNVNFPPLPATEVKGRKVVSQGFRPGARFQAKPQVAPTGRRYMWIHGGAQDVDTGPGTDVSANLGGYISVTPLRADLTAHDLLESLKERLE
ncbi:MAG: 5'/3'-nucleotidase SurE [Rhodobacteraceae bacterium]|nr:5'/3'-nucleotidase SurE [Paracoccaceae bacterium]